MAELYFAILRRDLLAAWRRPGDTAMPLLFFVLVATLFPLAMSPTREALAGIGAPALWVAVLLGTLLSLSALYRADLEDGTLEQLLLRDEPLVIVVLAKSTAHWLVAGAPLALLAPLWSAAYYLPPGASLTLLLTLLLGTPTLCLIGAVGASLTAGLRQAPGLLGLLVLPLMLPVLMFGARAVDAAAAGHETTGLVYVLAALFFLSLSLAPLAAAAALRISLD
ncbi:MAG: heme exporter protein CcmB [Gammaproteobacteria bacterium]|nr:heme exporter protein CcmB [Gammaproteobacteria bacterium]